MKKIYLGGPLFSEAEIAFNIMLEDALISRYGDKITIYNPCNNKEVNDKSLYADSIMIAEADNAHLEETDILIALMDGQVPDVGLASEIGYFYSFDRPIVALYSDVRQGSVTEEKVAALNKVAESQWSYINLYTMGLIKKRGKVVRSVDELVETIGTYLD